jgi:hypothetical protein
LRGASRPARTFASPQVVVSWHTLQAIQNPRVVLRRPDGKFEQTVQAETVSYTDAKAQQVVYAHHARIDRLQALSSYLYAALRLQPLFHPFNGDLCYANLAEDRVRTWWDFWENNSRSARNRPWMPSPGNHENELGKRPPVYVTEQAPWSAVRNAAHAYGFAAFEVDPGSRGGGITTIKVTYYDVVGPGGQLVPFETFLLSRPRGDA